MPRRPHRVWASSDRRAAERLRRRQGRRPGHGDWGDPSSLFAIYNLSAALIPAAVSSLSGEVRTAAPAMADLASDQFLRVVLDPTATGRLDASAPGQARQPIPVSRARVPTSLPPLPARCGALFGLGLGLWLLWPHRRQCRYRLGQAQRRRCPSGDGHRCQADARDDRRRRGLRRQGTGLPTGRARQDRRGCLPGRDLRHDAARSGEARRGTEYARLENDVSRSIPVLGSSLASSYTTTAWSGRLQASAALLSWNGLSLSPLAAIQSTRAHSPAAIEANWGGADAGALALARRNDITARGELGVQIDSDTTLGGVRSASPAPAAASRPSSCRTRASAARRRATDRKPGR